MPRFVAPLMKHLSRGRLIHGSAVESPSLPPQARDDADIARRLGETLDHAMDLGEWAHAERIAETAARLAPHSPKLTEQLARLRLAQGDPETALSLIESCRSSSSSLRMLRAVCLVQTGRKGEAHLDLQRWSRKAAAPLSARIMLALLEWESGHWHDAVAALMQNLKQIEDPATLAALTVMCAAGHRRDQALTWAERLHEACAFSATASEFDVLASSLGLGAAHRAAEPTPIHVTILASELMTHEETIPALVAAHQCDAHSAAARLLARAIRHALPDLNDQVVAHAALRDLADFIGGETKPDVLATIGRPRDEGHEYREQAA